MEERVNAQQTRNERGQGLMRLAGMVYEAARHRQSRMTEIRVPVGETEVKWEERGRGKANMWSGSELVLCPKVQSAESFLHPSCFYHVTEI